jgi:hypothetical protein
LCEVVPRPLLWEKAVKIDERAVWLNVPVKEGGGDAVEELDNVKESVEDKVSIDIIVGKIDALKAEEVDSETDKNEEIEVLGDEDEYNEAVTKVVGVNAAEKDVNGEALAVPLVEEN